MEIIYTEPIWGNCPVQAKGTIDGYPFYFRSRGEHWSVRISNKGQDPVEGTLFKHGDVYKNGEPYLAGWATEDECKAFINKAAELFIKELEDSHD